MRLRTLLATTWLFGVLVALTRGQAGDANAAADAAANLAGQPVQNENTSLPFANEAAPAVNASTSEITFTPLDTLAYNMRCDPATYRDHCPIGAICGKSDVNVTQADGNVTRESIFVCKCLLMNEKNDTGCYNVGKIGQECNPNVETNVCEDPNGVCEVGGTVFMSIHLWQCKKGYISCDPERNGTKACYKEISIDDTNPVDPCRKCIKHGGVCYDADNDDVYDSCCCTISRSGEFCEKKHVIPHCNYSTNIMKICYDPHPHLVDRFNAGNATMYALDRTHDGCTAKRADDGMCTDDDGTPLDDVWVLMFSTDPSVVDSCGLLQTFGSDAATTKEDSIRIAIDAREPDTYSYDDFIVLDASCTRDYKSIVSPIPYYIKALPQNNLAFVVKAHVCMRISAVTEWDPPTSTDMIQCKENNALTTRPQAFRMGAKLVIDIFFVPDGTYVDMVVTKCLYSPNNRDDKKPFPVIEDGCPTVEAVRRGFFAEPFGKLRVGETNNIQSTAETSKDGIPAPMFGGSNTVFMFCTVHLCVKGEEDECRQPTCPTNGVSSKRKRRAAENEWMIAGDENGDSANVNENISGSFIVYDDNTDPDNVHINIIGFALLMCILILLLLIFMVLTICLYLRIRQTNRKDVETTSVMGQQPQRFAMPRINRTDIRM